MEIFEMVMAAVALWMGYQLVTLGEKNDEINKDR